MIYHWAGSLCRWEHGQETGEVLPITLPSPQFHVQRKFVYGSEEWEDFALHPKGHSVALSVRGRLASMPLWELAATAWQGREPAIDCQRISQMGDW